MMAGASLLGSLFGKKGGGAPVVQDVRQTNNQSTNVSVNTNVGALPNLSYTLGSYEATANRYLTGAEGVLSTFDANGKRIVNDITDYSGRVSAMTLGNPNNQSPIGTVIGFRPPGAGAPALPGSAPLHAFDARYPWAKYAAAAGLGLLVLRKVTHA